MFKTSTGKEVQECRLPLSPVDLSNHDNWNSFSHERIGASWATKYEKCCYLSLFDSCKELVTCKKLSLICGKVSSLDVYFELELYFMTLYSRVGMRYAVKTTRSRSSKGNFQPSAHLDIVAAYAGDILRRRSLLVFRGKLVLDC